MTVVPIDTNLFLHYRSIDQIAWLKLLGVTAVRLFIPPVVIRELNKHKDGHPVPRLRKRAATAIASLGNWVNGARPVQIRDGVTLEIFPHDPTLDFAAHSLHPDIADDFFIASILELREREKDLDITVLTADVGLRLKCSSHGLNVTAPPEDLKLPEDPDPNGLRIKNLEREIRELKHRVPSLVLSFIAGGRLHKSELKRLPALTAVEITAKQDALRQKFPRLSYDEVVEQKWDRFGEITARKVDLSPSMLGGITKEAVDTYNRALEPFFESMVTYFPEERACQDANSRQLRLSFKLVNEGTSPANDISIFMHFPDGFLVTGTSDVIRDPKQPKPPEKPRSYSDMLQSAMRNPHFDSMFSSLRPVHAPKNVSAPQIRRTNSYDVNIHVKRLKHGFEESLDPVYITFEKWDDVRSFAIDYTIHAEELPTRLMGTLNVAVKAEA